MMQTIKQKQEKLLINDDVYGQCLIDSPLLVQLIESTPVQRLKKISQAGASSLVRQGRNVTRFEHSLGVMILAKKLGASLDECAFALLHDVSHTAFSHTIDFVFDDKEEEFHERLIDDVIESSEIPKILDDHGLNWAQISQESAHTIVDTPAPNLCADRIDYTLRDLIRFGALKVEDARKFVETLEASKGFIVVRGKTSALKFVEWYALLVEELFMNQLELFSHRKLALTIKKGLAREVINSELFMSDDGALLRSLEGDTDLLAEIDELRKITPLDAKPINKIERVRSKVRIVDPITIIGKQQKPISFFEPTVSCIWSQIKDKGTRGVEIAAIF